MIVHCRCVVCVGTVIYAATHLYMLGRRLICINFLLIYGDCHNIGDCFFTEHQSFYKNCQVTYNYLLKW